MTWAPDYVNVEDLAAYAGIVGDEDDVQLALAITSASRVVDAFCHRQFGSAVQARTYPVRFDYARRVWYVAVDDVQAVTSVVVDGIDVTADAVLEPVNATANGRPYTRIRLAARGCEAVVSGNPFGWTAFPDPVVQATLLQANNIFFRRNAPHGIAGSPDMDGDRPMLEALDRGLRPILAPYRRPGAVG